MGDGSRRMPLSEDDLREITGFAARCARQALSLFEAHRPTDRRPREAIEGAEAFAGGERRTAALRSQAWAANRSAGETEDPAAAEAARAASQAAAAAYLHPLADAHQVKHVLGSAVHQARALELAAGGDEDVGDEQVRWAVTQATPAVGEILRRMPPAPGGRGRAADLRRRLDQELRR